MPKYQLSFHRKAEKALDSLDQKTKQRLLEDIGCLADFTGLRSRLDIVKLEGQKDLYRMRSGSRRIEFFVHKETKTIFILRIQKRENVYEK